MGWLVVLIIAIIIGAIWGFLSSKDGERGGGAAAGAITAGMGCGYILFQIFLWGVGILFMIWIFCSLFG
ncbi:MAG: hypothetical protein IJV33_00940 [Bacteroidaceae bacterium]|nr:hypothetical protein [Bacteroidaceae bacterium]